MLQFSKSNPDIRAKGILTGMQSAASSVQSSLGSWVATACGFGAVLIVLSAVLIASDIYNFQRVDSAVSRLDTKADDLKASFSNRADELSKKIDDASSGVASVRRDVESVSEQVKSLPATLSRDLIGLARDISTIRQGDKP